VYHIGHIQKIGSLKTAESQRDLALTPEIRKILLRKRALLGGNPDEEELLFLTVRGTSVDGRSLLQFFNKITKEIGLPRLTIHEIRHTVASLLYTKGVPAKVAQGILGHKSIVTTLQVYTHSTAEERADAVTDLVSLYSDTRMSPTESSS
jgi:integrase